HVLHVDLARRDERVDAPALGALEGLGRALDVAGGHAGERRDHGPAHARRDLANRLELALARDGKARLQHVDAETGELLRDLDLLGLREGDAGGLLAVAERRIEDAYYVVRHREPPSSRIPARASSFVARAPPARCARRAPPAAGQGSGGSRPRPPRSTPSRRHRSGSPTGPAASARARPRRSRAARSGSRPTRRCRRPSTASTTARPRR